MQRGEAPQLPEHVFPRDEWRLVERRWSPRLADRMETLFALSNGYLGIRATPDEGRPSLSPGTFVNGLHETWPIVHAEEAYGLARVGQTIVNAPDATVLQLYVDDEPLFLAWARVSSYERVLDLRAGTLQRDLVWVTPSGKHAHVRSRRLVSLEERHVAAIEYEVTVDSAAPVVVVSQLVNREDLPPEREAHPPKFGDPRLGNVLGHRVLERETGWADDRRLSVGYRVARSGMTLGVAVDHDIQTDNDHQVHAEVEPDRAQLVVTVDAQPGEPIRIVKYVSYQSSRSVPVGELTARCGRTLDRVYRLGFDWLVERQRENLDRFWDRTDVKVDDGSATKETQQAIRWNLFQVAQATWRAEGAGVPAKGLTGRGYDGHYFWDQEMYLLPVLSYTHPRLARNLLRFRYSMLEKARMWAKVLGGQGAVFPWRTINGDEASANFQAGTAQYHLDADIAYAVRRYVHARGGTDFLVELGFELLVETARMWADLGFYGTDGCFHIHGVTGPDEYTTVVNDNAFTNLMARQNLRYAIEVARTLAAERADDYLGLSIDLDLQPDEIDGWQRADEAMFIPYDSATGVNPQDDTFLAREPWDLARTPPEDFPLLLHHHPLVIYRHQVIKQPDVVMAMFLLGDQFSTDEKARNFHYYNPLTTGDSSLSASIQSIVAAEIGDSDAADGHFDDALYYDLSDSAGNVASGVHVAAAGGAWMALVFGFGGVRDFDGQLTIDPALPQRWRSLSFSVRFHDRQLRIHLAHDTETYLLESGDPLEVAVRGEKITLRQGSPHVIDGADHTP